MPVVGGTEGVEVSSGMTSALAAVEAAGDNIFTYQYENWYTDLSFETRDRTGDLLTGRITPEQWVEAVQAKADEIKADPNVPKYTRS
jgi:N-acetylglucosamine transport system substrate-binding protein